MTARRDLDWLFRSSAAVVTRTDVAELLGVDERTVTRAIDDGQLPSLRIGRRVLIPRLPLLAMLEGASPNAATAAPRIDATREASR